MWKFIKRNGPVARAVLVVSSVGVLVTGVTFAALQSQQVTLTGNSIQTPTAGLLISLDGINYSNTQPGFSFPNVIPGGEGGTVPFYLRSTGTSPLAINMGIGSDLTNPANVDLSKVYVTLSDPDSGSTQKIDFQSLVDGYKDGNGVTLQDILRPSDKDVTYKLGITMDSDAFTGTSASLGNIDFVFTGVATLN